MQSASNTMPQPNAPDIMLPFMLIDPQILL